AGFCREQSSICAAYPDLGEPPTNGPAWPSIGWGLPGRRVTATPVRSYRTISPLPASGSAEAPGLGGVISVALSRGFPRVGVTDHPCPVMSGLSSKVHHLRDCSACISQHSAGILRTSPAINRPRVWLCADPDRRLHPKVG